MKRNCSSATLSIARGKEGVDDGVAETVREAPAGRVLAAARCLL